MLSAMRAPVVAFGASHKDPHGWPKDCQCCNFYGLTNLLLQTCLPYESESFLPASSDNSAY